jgi:catechol 2,3-dioxygenase-like lactoylglutathione lyase family enzyme
MGDPMLSHVYIRITDFQRAFAFYQSVMDILGFPLKFVELEKSWAGWKPADAERPLFLVGIPYNGERATPGTVRW